MLSSSSWASLINKAENSQSTKVAMKALDCILTTSERKGTGKRPARIMEGQVTDLLQ